MHSNKEARKTMKEWGTKGFPMLIGRGYHTDHGRYVIYQWNVHGFRFHANFYYPV